MEFRGQCTEVALFLKKPCVFQGLNLDCQVQQQMPLPLSHLTGPKQ